MEGRPESVTDPLAALAASDLFDADQRSTLEALCDTFIPALEPPAGDEEVADFWGRPASALAVPQGVEVGLLAAGLPGDQADGLRALLDELARAGMASATPQEAREQIVHAVSDSGPEALAGIATLRAIGASIFYAAPDPGTGRNPNWDAMGFPGPPAASEFPAERERPLRVRRPEPGEVIDADVCVVGSGAGGGVIAAELAEARQSVVVVEAGEYHDDADFDGLELAAYERSYLNGGPFPSAEGQVSIVAGAGVGGGTVVNWTNCLRTLDHGARSGRLSTVSPTSPSPASTRTSTRSSSASRSTPIAAT